MKALKLSAMLLGAALFLGLSSTTLSAEMKCGAGKCGGAKKEAPKSKCGAGKCGGAEKKAAAKCGDAKKEAPKKAMKCGAGKCGGNK